MSRADYAHWNEDADRVWWMDEGRHASDPESNSDMEWANEHDFREMEDDDDEEA
jgi:hypothetical protein